MQKIKTFSSILTENKLDTNEHWLKRLQQVTDTDVQKALNSTPGTYSQEKLLALISEPAQKYLEQMARAAQKLTIQRFGKTIRLYAPLYVSNFCCNSCQYCGFNKQNNFKRTRLTVDQAIEDAKIIANEGFSDILLVSSEDPKFITIDYLSKLAEKLRKTFSFISLEIFQLTTEQYRQLFNAGIEGVTIYQETYNRDVFNHYHKAGPKADYPKRLQAPDDIAAAGIREIGLGSLLGLNNWQIETLAMATQASYLMKKYWKSHISFSFPRMRPACDVDRQKFDHLLSDKHLVQMILALRLCFADAGLVISTRESASLRDNLINIGITKMSAGSKTNPGGYTEDHESLEQFQIDDARTPHQINDMLKKKGFDPVWKDWDTSFIDTKNQPQ